MPIRKMFFAPRPGLKLVITLLVALAALPTLAQTAPAETPKAEAPKEAPATENVAPADHTPATTAEDSTIKTTDVVSRTVAETHGASSWEDGYVKIGEALAKLHAAAQKAGLKENGRPQVAFTETDDAGFKYDAMLPVVSPAGAKPDLGTDISLAQSPSGKAIKFQHRGAYDDIDSTYEAITAYLDEKGLDARNLFVEEYLNDAKDSTDMALQVDIYVFLK